MAMNLNKLKLREMNLREYAAHIFAHAEALQSYLDSQDEKLGFEADARPSNHFPQELQETRIALMSACQTMCDLVEGPEYMMLYSPFLAVHDLGAYKLLYHYQLWKLVPENGTISYEDVAKPLKIEVKRLTAYIRHLITRRIFLEPEPDRVGHSAASLLLARDEGLQCWLGAVIDDQAEAVQALPETYDANGLSLDPTLSPFNVARKDNSMGGMALVLSDKKRGHRYARGFGWTSTTQVASNEVILDSYPWEQFDLVADVAGGNGNFSFALARRYPKMRCIIQDIAAQASYFKAPEDITDRLEYQVHDIFTPQKVQADLYVLRTVLHVFGDDEKAAAILKNILPAMKPTSRILLVDTVLDLDAPVAWSRIQAATNCVMHSLCGKDRTAKEWAEVIRLVSPDLELGQIVSPPGRAWSLIEIVRKGSATIYSPIC